MDKLTFIVEMSKSLAWPIAIVVITITFKKPLVALLEQLEQVNVKGTEFKFSKAMKQIKIDAESTFFMKDATEIPSNLIKLVELSPRGALLEAWIEVDDSLQEARKRCALRKRSETQYETPLPLAVSMNLLTSFVTRNLISKDALNLYQKLRAIRNEVVHATKIRLTTDEVIDFIELATKLKSTFDSMTPEESNNVMEPITNSEMAFDCSINH